MTIDGSLGVESRLLGHLPDRGMVTAEYRITSGHELLAGTPLNVEIRARVYRFADAQALGRIPDRPFREGPVVHGTAGPKPNRVELLLPWAPHGDYAVVAKVESRDDDRYPTRIFIPSECFAGRLTYALEPASMRLQDLEDVYAGINNPLVEEEIRRRVSRGVIIVHDEEGNVFRSEEQQGKLILHRVQPPPPTPQLTLGTRYRNWTGHPFWITQSDGAVLDVPQELRHFYLGPNNTLLTLDLPSTYAREFSLSDLPPPQPGVLHIVIPQVIARFPTRTDLWDGSPLG